MSKTSRSQKKEVTKLRQLEKNHDSWVLPEDNHKLSGIRLESDRGVFYRVGRIQSYLTLPTEPLEGVSEEELLALREKTHAAMEQNALGMVKATGKALTEVICDHLWSQGAIFVEEDPDNPGNPRICIELFVLTQERPLSDSESYAVTGEMGKEPRAVQIGPPERAN